MSFYPQTHRSRNRLGFTLIELLTVIAIIGILAAILIPTVSKVRSTAKKAECVARLRQWGTAISLQANECKSKVILGNVKHPNPPANDQKIEYLLDVYFNSGGNVVFEAGSGKSTTNKSATRAFWGCPTGINGGATLTAAQYAFVVPAGVSATKPTITLLGAQIPKYYSLGEVSAPSKLVLMIEVKNGANAVDVPSGGIKAALEAANGVRSMQTEAGFVRHGGNTMALFVDGHVSPLSLTDTDYTNATSKQKLDQWFSL